MATCTFLIHFLALKLFPVRLTEYSFTYVLCAPSFPKHFILTELSKLRKNASSELHTLVSTDSSFSYRILLWWGWWKRGSVLNVTSPMYTGNRYCCFSIAYNRNVWAAVGVPRTKLPSATSLNFVMEQYIVATSKCRRTSKNNNHTNI
jgi:hypothetical protein